MDYDVRIPVFLFCNLVLVWLVQTVNGVLGQYGLTLFLGSALLIAPALFLRLRWALIVAGLTGLFQGAATPLSPNGFLFVAYAIALIPLYLNSPQLRRLRAPQILLFALGINALLLLGLGLVLAQGRLGNTDYSLRLAADSAVSALLFYPVAKWFMNFQRCLCSFFGDDLRSARARE